MHDNKLLCIYHGNCADGFGAAWAVRHALGEDRVEFLSGVYQQDPPEVRGRDIIFVDFCYQPDVMCRLANEAASLLVLDHHKSAAEKMLSWNVGHQVVDLSKYSGPLHWSRYLANVEQDRCENVTHAIYCLFDMQRSGAGIAWDFFHPDEPRPDLINHIEDRDLWRFAIPGTRKIQAALFSFPYDFETWDALMQTPVGVLCSDGEAIERKHFKDIEELLKVCQRTMEIAGHVVPVASLPYTLTSDAGHQMAQGHPFAACYWDTENTRVFSLRSTEEGADVSEIANHYGGGGHKHAAGFAVPRDHKLARA